MLLLSLPLLGIGGHSDDSNPSGITIKKWHHKPMKSENNSGSAIILVDFWASWCGPCYQSLPKLETYKELFKAKLEVIIISQESSSKINAALGKLPDQFYVAEDAGSKTFARYSVQAIPYTIIFSADDGELLWEGHPNDLSSDLLDSLSQKRNHQNVDWQSQLVEINKPEITTAKMVITPTPAAKPYSYKSNNDFHMKLSKTQIIKNLLNSNNEMMYEFNIPDTSIYTIEYHSQVSMDERQILQFFCQAMKIRIDSISEIKPVLSLEVDENEMDFPSRDIFQGAGVVSKSEIKEGNYIFDNYTLVDALKAIEHSKDVIFEISHKNGSNLLANRPTDWVIPVDVSEIPKKLKASYNISVEKIRKEVSVIRFTQL